MGNLGVCGRYDFVGDPGMDGHECRRCSCIFSGMLETVKWLDRCPNSTVLLAGLASSPAAVDRNVIAPKYLHADAAMITMIAVMCAERLENG
jgi:hypothetical protein